MQEARLRTAARYLAHIVNGELDGSSEVSAALEFAAAEPAMKVVLRDIAIRGKTFPAWTKAAAPFERRTANLTV
jgi:hypothetical protein